MRGRPKGSATNKRLCTDHCRECNRHFHSLAAFDAHRVDGECQEPSVILTQPSIKNKKAVEHPALMLYTDAGFCRLAKGCYWDGRLINTLHPVDIWQLWQSEEQKQKLREWNARRD